MKFSKYFYCGKPLRQVMPELVADRTTGRSIVFATDTYEYRGDFYRADQPMIPLLTLSMIFEESLLPRVQKTKEQQQSRTKARAEVFTPSWICNKMNNFCDEDWFQRPGVFNTENDDHTWTVTEDPVSFSGDLAGWERYVDSKRIEITCGEAPYLVSRYDAATGEPLEIKQRIGILDRKLRIVNENTSDEKEWLKWAYRAFEATYGFEYQGDNLFFARVNLVLTFIDYYRDRFGKDPEIGMVKHVANIVSWNLWQMDGLKDTVPYSPESRLKKENKPVYCRIRDWRSRQVFEYREMKGEKRDEV